MDAGVHLGADERDQARDAPHHVLVLAGLWDLEHTEEPAEQRLQLRLEVCHGEARPPVVLHPEERQSCTMHHVDGCSDIAPAEDALRSLLCSRLATNPMMTSSEHAVGPMPRGNHGALRAPWHPFESKRNT
jgi:hypothetical protein